MALWKQAYQIYDDLIASGGTVDGLKSIKKLIGAPGATKPRSIYTLMRKQWVCLNICIP